jgi:hypothetical protein
VARPLSSSLSAYLGIDALTARAAAPVPEAHVYVPPELASSEERPGGPSSRQRVPTPAQSTVTTYEVLPKYPPADATAAISAASSFFHGWGQPKAQRNKAKLQQQAPHSSAGLHNASHWMRASSMAATGTQRRAATTAAIADPCLLRAVYVRRPLNEKQANDGLPEPAFETRPSCSHTLMASEVRITILAKSKLLRMVITKLTWHNISKLHNVF